MFCQFAEQRLGAVLVPAGVDNADMGIGTPSIFLITTSVRYDKLMPIFYLLLLLLGWLWELGINVLLCAAS